MFATWHDPDLGQSCWFATTPDGQMRCAPTIDPGMGYSLSISTYYSRSDCAAATRFLSAPRYAGPLGATSSLVTIATDAELTVVTSGGAAVARFFQTTGAALQGLKYYW